VKAAQEQLAMIAAQPVTLNPLAEPVQKMAVGAIAGECKIIQIMGPNDVVVEAPIARKVNKKKLPAGDEFVLHKTEETIWISGIPTDGLAVGIPVSIPGSFLIAGTKTYKTPSGKERTVPLAEKLTLSDYVEEPAKKP
jgi:hypothetical protein